MHPNVHSSNAHNSQTVERDEMPFNRQMDKDVVHVNNGYYAAIRKDKYPAFASTWMGLEEIMLIEITQGRKVNYHMVSLTRGTEGIAWMTSEEGREK